MRTYSFSTLHTMFGFLAVMTGVIGCDTEKNDDENHDAHDTNTDDSDTNTVDPLKYHDGYWVGQQENSELPMPVTIINDMHVDLTTRRATVYAQMQALGMVVSPPQVGPGECTTLPNGTPVCFHPNAVYLNGTGVELDEADGTGQWWVKHSWVVGGDGYQNWELAPKESYGDGAWVEGVLADDGVSMRVTAEGGFYNIRTPLLDTDPVAYEVIRHNPDGTVGWVMGFECSDEPSAFDNQTRPCPVVEE